MILVDQFRAHEQMIGYASRTIERRCATVMMFAAFAGGAVADRALVEAFLAPRPSAATRRAYLGDLRRFYGWAVERGHVAADPTVGIDTPRVPERDPSPLSGLQVRRLLATVQGHEEALAVNLGLRAGLRASEAAALAATDCDFDARIIHVRHGKGDRARRVPMAATLVPLLDAGVLRAANRQGYYDTVKRALRRAGIDARPHDLRHTFGTELARQCNGNLVLVARLMGHKSMNTTRRYVGWNPGGVDAVDGLFAA